MTFAGSLGPGPRTGGQPGARARRGPRAIRSSLAVVLVCLAAGGCGSDRASGTATPRGASPAPATASANQVAGPAASVPAQAAPSPSGAAPSTAASWPGTTVLATIALGAADGEIQKAGMDLQDAVDRHDVKAMWGAADGLATMIDGLLPSIATLESYPVTAPAGAIYRKAFPELSAAARRLRDAITAGDPAGVVAGAQAMQQGLADYAPVRPLIGALVQQALAQQRLLVR